MAIRNVHIVPFKGTLRDAVKLARLYYVPELVLLMIASFAVSYFVFLLLAQRSLEIVGAAWALRRVIVPLYFVLGNWLFAMLFWAFFRAMLTSAGYVPAEPWRNRPNADATEQHHTRVEWAKQKQWLQQNRCETALALYQQQITFLQAVFGISVPPESPAGAPHATPPAPAPPLMNPSAPADVAVCAAPSKSAGHSGIPVSTSSCLSSRSSHSASEGELTRPAGPCRLSAPQSAAAAVVAVPVGAAAGSNPFTVHELEADGSVRYCDRCAQFKPDNCHHCRVCDRCTADMDHHCLYLHNCVGLRNYKFFFLTISYGTACGSLCSCMYLHTYYIVSNYAANDAAGELQRMHAASAAATAALSLTARQQAVAFGYLWLACPISMLLVNVLVFFLWRQHWNLLQRGESTLRRMRASSVERFIFSFKVQQYGRCAPETNAWCALYAELKERTRCMLYMVTHDKGAVDEEAEYARMLAREGKGEGDALSPDGATPSDKPSASTQAAAQRDKHFRRLFGSPRYAWMHLLPLRPYGTGELPGEAEDADGAKLL